MYFLNSNLDLETRLGAIDALGNFFKTTSVTTIESIIHQNQTNSTTSSLSSTSIASSTLLNHHNNSKFELIESNTQNLSSTLEVVAIHEIQTLQSLLRRSLIIILENLRECSNWILKKQSWFDSM